MAQDTRAAVLTAAGELFAERGWSATGMRDVARRAKVSVETVYASAGCKTDLLTQVIDVAIVGDDEPVAMADRPEFMALGQGDREARVEAAVALLGALNARVGRLRRTLAQGAPAEPALAERLAQSRDNERAIFRVGVALVLDAEPPQRLVDGIWAVGTPDVYLLLVESAGWSDPQYQRWLAGMIARQLDTLEETR